MADAQDPAAAAATEPAAAPVAMEVASAPPADAAAATLAPTPSSETPVAAVAATVGATTPGAAAPQAAPPASPLPAAGGAATATATATAPTATPKPVKVRRMSAFIPGPPSQRKSSRSHKRKKFDDEILASSYSDKRKRKDDDDDADIFEEVIPKRSRSGASKTARTASGDSQYNPVAAAATATAHPPGSPARGKGQRPPPLKGDVASLRWSPEDDYRLVINVCQTPDPMVIFHSVKFTRQFTLRDIKERWFGILYDTDVCRQVCAGIAVLDEEEKRLYRNEVMYSAAEENELRSIRPGPDNEIPPLEQFVTLLHKRSNVFALGRTAAALRVHWTRMQHMHLLNSDPSCGRIGRMMQGTPAAAKAAAAAMKGQAGYSFSDACRQLTPKTVAALQSAATADPAAQRHIDRELEVVDRKNKRKIRKLEHQIALWRSFDDLGIKLPSLSSSFDDTTLAILRGTKLEYHMRSRQIIAGRKTDGAEVDVDLSIEEASPSRISRAQFLVKLRHDRHFYLTNLGKRPTYVNGQPVLRGARCRLFANSVIEICSVAVLFTVNDDLMRALRAEV
eukprot:m.442811 g.442811  ORF g.442811 m.442811 type:complete len:565 (-) comp18863_c0_seq1:123-1817(-)